MIRLVIATEYFEFRAIDLFNGRSPQKWLPAFPDCFGESENGKLMFPRLASRAIAAVSAVCACLEGGKKNAILGEFASYLKKVGL